MSKGKLIVIEGTDASGKATQTKLLVDRIRSEGILVESMSFPRYNTPTGRIIGGPYLGKPNISECWWTKGSDSVDPRIASLYYAADRFAAREEILEIINSGTNLVLDRYVWANMGHQGGKIRDPEERTKIYKFIEDLEFGLLELPRPDKTIFLYVPTKNSIGLREKRKEFPDGHESDLSHLRRAEDAYVQLAKMYDWTKIDCLRSGEMRAPQEISLEVFSLVKNSLFSI